MTQPGNDLSETTLTRIRDSFSRQGLMAHLGARIDAIGPGTVTISLPFRAELTQQHGYFHGGTTAAIADAAGGYAGSTLMPDNSSVLTVEFKLNLLNPAQGQLLEATGRIVKSGRTLTVSQIDVWAVDRHQRVHVATGVQTLICVPDRAPGS